MSHRPDIVVGLDIGTTKIAVIVAQITHESLQTKQMSGSVSSSHGKARPSSAFGLDIIGIGTYPSQGLRKGVVINIEATIESIRKAVQEAELMAGCEISQVYAGIAGSHIKGFNSHGIVAVKNKEITPKDIERVIDAARAVAIPMDREILHILPQEYIVDDQDGIREPLGMSGVRLEAKVHIVTGAVSSGQNIIKCANRVGLSVADIVLEPIASAEAVLSPEEKELGVALIDIGGGTTDITVFHAGSVKHTAVIPVGGNHLTNDISAGLRTPYAAAEQLKRRYGCAMSNLVHSGETIEVPQTGGREPKLLARTMLSDVIEPRMEEILSLVHAEVSRSGYIEMLTAGVVLTGGSVLLEGCIELGEQTFNLPVRIGYPEGVGGLVDVVNSPSFATGVGLVLFGAKEKDIQAPFVMPGTNIFERVRSKMMEWVAAYF